MPKAALWRYDARMASRRFRVLLFCGTGLISVLAAAVLGISWWSRGPGLEAEVNRFAALVELRPGLTVADIGAGTGGMAVRVARRLGPSGRLYATEIEASKLGAIRNAAQAAGLANVVVLEAGEHSTHLPDACCDLIYLRRVYHHLSDAPAINKSICAALRPGGRLAVIDFLSPRWMFFFHHGIPSDTVTSQVRPAGFTIERQVARWSPVDYCLVFRKAMIP